MSNVLAKLSQKQNSAISWDTMYIEVWSKIVKRCIQAEKRICVQASYLQLRGRKEANIGEWMLGMSQAAVTGF